MRLPHLILFILLGVNLLCDSYVWAALRRRCRTLKPSRIYAWSSALLTALWVAILLTPSRGGDDRSLDVLMWLLVTYLSFYVPKYIFVVLDLLASLPCLFHRPRLKPVTMIGFIIAIIAFAAIWWGTLINRYRTQSQ